MPNLFDHGRALVVGVANYPNARKLPEHVLDDARDLAGLLRSSEYCGYPASQVETLLDDQAKAEDIRAGLTRLAQSAGTNDTVVVFFSGHGGRIEAGPGEGTYLIPFDYDPKRLRDTAISAVELTRLLSVIKAGRLVVLLDACHSAGAGDVKTLDPSEQLKAGFDNKTYSSLAEGAGRVIMASSRSTEVSLVLPGMKNSLFTHYLLEALKGAASGQEDRLIRVFEVFKYVSDKVPVLASSQHPIFKAHDLENDFPLALDRGGKQLVPTPTATKLAARPEKLSGKARIKIREGIVSRWVYLADYFEMSLPDRDACKRDESPAGKLLDWMEERSLLPSLRDAFQYLGWDNLIEVLDSHPQ